MQNKNKESKKEDMTIVEFIICWGCGFFFQLLVYWFVGIHISEVSTSKIFFLWICLFLITASIINYIKEKRTLAS